MRQNTEIHQAVHVKPEKNITSVAIFLIVVMMAIQVLMATVSVFNIDLAPSRPLFVAGEPLDILQIKGERLPE